MTGTPTKPSLQRGLGLLEATTLIVGGTIGGEIRDSTVDVLQDGSLDVRSLDWVPAGPRA